LLYHYQFRKVFANFDYIAVGQIKSRIYIAAEITREFATCFKFNIIEHIEEILDEISKETIDELMSHSWLQLMKELIALNLVKVILISLSCEYLYAIIKLPTEIFGSAFLQPSQPQLDLFASIIDEILERNIRNNKLIH